MSHPLEFDELVKMFHHQLAGLPDQRTGQNKQYSLKDAALGALAVFFTQSPSFLAYQRTMKQSKGRSNAETLFGLEQIPCDNQIRVLLDGQRPNAVYPVFAQIFTALEQAGELKSFRVLNGQLLISLDGTNYFSSERIHCPHCSERTSSEGYTTYFHSVITPVVVAPGRSQVISLEPEFIRPQDGHDKQDCERAAAKRWVEQYAARYPPQTVTLLGDDLYSNQPLCELLVQKELNFILVCKPDSHTILYEWLDFLAANDDIEQVCLHRWNGRFTQIETYRYVNEVPLRGGEDALLVNWAEITITHSKTGEQLYHNAFVTRHPLSAQSVAPVIQAGRARWKSENETVGEKFTYKCVK